MKQTFSVIILFLLVISSCLAPENIVQTRPVYAGDTTALSGYTYGLTQTSFKLTLELVKTRTIRGPYYRFAERLLNLEDVPAKNSNSYAISNVVLESYYEVDPGQYYQVKQISGYNDLSPLLSLGHEGLIYHHHAAEGAQTNNLLPGSSPEGPLFTELSMEKNTVMSIDTFYKTILTDTSFVRVPVMKEQLIVKTFDEKASEAADFILELRYERYMMLTGNNATLVSDYGVQRLDEIEQDYLELFIGKSFDEKYRYTFYFTPSGDEVFENIELFEFSKSRGIVEEGIPDSDVLSLGIRNTGKTEILKNQEKDAKLPVMSNALYYRVPDLAEIEISLGGRTLLKDRCQVNQFGKVLSLPITPAE